MQSFGSTKNREGTVQGWGSNRRHQGGGEKPFKIDPAREKRKMPRNKNARKQGEWHKQTERIFSTGFWAIGGTYIILRWEQEMKIGDYIPTRFFFSVVIVALLRVILTIRDGKQLILFRNIFANDIIRLIFAALYLDLWVFASKPYHFLWILIFFCSFHISAGNFESREAMLYLPVSRASFIWLAVNELQNIVLPFLFNDKTRRSNLTENGSQFFAGDVFNKIFHPQVICVNYDRCRWWS